MNYIQRNSSPRIKALSTSMVAFSVFATLAVTISVSPSFQEASRVLAQHPFASPGQSLSPWVSRPLFGDVPEVATSSGPVPISTEAEVKALPDGIKSILICSDAVDAVAPALQRFKHLEVFDMTQSARFNIKLLDALAKHPTLREIRLHGGFGALGTPTDGDYEAISKLKALTSLDVDFPRGELTGLLKALKNCPKLTRLSVHEFMFNTPKGVNTDARGIGELKGLKEFEFLGSTMSTEAMSELVTLPNLTKVSFNHTAFSSEAAALLGNLCTRVTSLSLDYAKFPADAAMEFATEGAEPLKTTVKSLVFSNAFFGADWVPGDKMFASVGKLVELEHLTLACWIDPRTSPPKPVGTVSAEALSGLAGLSKLKHLDLTGHQVTEGLLASISKAMSKLEVIVLAHCSASDLTPAAIAALGSLASLRSLDLSYTDAGTGHAAAAAELTQPLSVSFSGNVKFNSTACAALAKSTSIVSLDVSRCPITHTALRDIASLKQLVRLNLSHCADCKPTSWPATPALESLWLDGSGIGTKALPTASKAPKLQALSIHHKSSAISSDAIASIAKLKNLRYLNVAGIPAAHDKLEALKALGKLEWLVVGEDSVVKDSAVVSAPLGAGGFAKLRRLDTFVSMNVDAINITNAVKIVGLPKELRAALEKRFPKAEIHIHGKDQTPASE